MAEDTIIRRSQQHRDRWTNYVDNPGILSFSERLTVQELREFDLFESYDDRFLEKISPDVSVVRWQKGSVLFEEGSYLDLAFFVLSGSVEVYLAKTAGSAPIFDDARTGSWSVAEILAAKGASAGDSTPAPPPSLVGAVASGQMPSEITFLATMDFDLPRDEGRRLGAGEIFGEIGALSGWPQSVTARAAEDCELIQIRVPSLRLMKRKSKELKERVDRLFRSRSFTAQLKCTPLFQRCADDFVEGLKERVELISCDPGETIATQGDPVDAFYMVRSGFLKLSQSVGEGEVAVSYLSKGMTLGEVELLIPGLDGWQTTASSVAHSELVRLRREDFEEMIRRFPAAQELLWEAAVLRVKESGHGRRSVEQSHLIQIALDQGLVEGNSILVIDLDRCTRCDDCVRGCAQTHGGRPRFVREGSKYQNLLVPRSCYHCQDPVCLIGCPTGAIHRTNVGEVVAIDDHICIGCQACANNCPYDAIVMHDTEEVWPDDMIPTGLRGRERKLASKCDLCYDTNHDPACVSNCPQGCAYRVSSLEEFRSLLPAEGD